MKVSVLHSKVLPSLLGGTSRHPPPADLIHPANSASDGALEMLSLMGQVLCFDRPLAPDSFAVEPEIKDEREIIDAALRRPLIRLLTAKCSTDHPARALARAFDRLRLRPHPFDLPLIESFVRLHAEKLGPTAQHWTDRQKPEAETRSYFDPESLDESNWAQARLSRRVAFLEQRRREDANTARALLESTWVSEEADARFRLLQALQTNLSQPDQRFLGTLEKDRAPRVRALATKFLSRLGAGGGNPSVAACLEQIKQTQSGLLRKRTVLQLELPANVKDPMTPRWILQTFGDVSFSELAGAFHFTETDLIEASVKDDHLLLALAFVATNDRRLDLLEHVVEHLPNAWERMVESGFDSLGTLAEPDRQRWAEIIVHSYRKDLPTVYVLWDWVYRVLDASTPASVMSMLLKANLLKKIPVREHSTPLWLEMLAAMCPGPQRIDLRAQLSEFEPALSANSIALLDILDGMEKNQNHV
jgi:Family of unknown function (DUF5691)